MQVTSLRLKEGIVGHCYSINGFEEHSKGQKSWERKETMSITLCQAMGWMLCTCSLIKQGATSGSRADHFHLTARIV